MDIKRHDVERKKASSLENSSHCHTPNYTSSYFRSNFPSHEDFQYRRSCCSGAPEPACSGQSSLEISVCSPKDGHSAKPSWAGKRSHTYRKRFQGLVSLGNLEESPERANVTLGITMSKRTFARSRCRPRMVGTAGQRSTAMKGTRKSYQKPIRIGRTVVLAGRTSSTTTRLEILASLSVNETVKGKARDLPRPYSS